MPGTDPAEALRVILGEVPDLPHLPELPGRGAGADLTGRTAALLVDLPVETTPRGWRFAARPGRDLGRARGYLARDLDALEEATSGYQGPLKVQLCGPWTLAATIELGVSQDPALADPGAVRDLAASLAEAVAAHMAEVAKRVPGARLLVQLDEPALPAVLAGAVPTASGYGRVAAVDAAAAQEVIRAVFDAVAESFGIVHCCAPIGAASGAGGAGEVRFLPAPLRMLAGAGAGAVSVDLTMLAPGAEDQIAELAEAGVGVLAGVVPATVDHLYPERLRGRGAAQVGAGPRGGAGRRGGAHGEGASPPGADDGVAAVASRVTTLWRRLGLPPHWFAERVVLTPACGLAGAPPRYAREALARCRDGARAAADELDG